MFLDPIYCKKPDDKFVGRERTCGELSFRVGDFVYLKVSPMIGLWRFKVRRKLMPKFARPIKIVVEREKYWTQNFQISFLARPNLGDEIHFKGVGLSQPKIPNLECG
jgi:hypothetical protein